MDALDGLRNVSDHNSNAQIDPARSGAVEMGEDFRCEMDHKYGTLSGTNGVPVDSTDVRKEHGRVLYECESYSNDDSQSDDDTVESLSEGHDGRMIGDGRRSCCSLSDETSSMSETELSAQGDDDESHLRNHIDDSSVSTPQEPDSTQSEESKSASRRNGTDDNESRADGTFTDLTLDSFNLSLMENCISEEENSALPEISTLEITDSEFSFDWGEPGGANVQNQPREKPEHGGSEMGKTDLDKRKTMDDKSVNVQENIRQQPEQVGPSGTAETLHHNVQAGIPYPAPIMFLPNANSTQAPLYFGHPWQLNTAQDPQGFQCTQNYDCHQRPQMVYPPYQQMWQGNQRPPQHWFPPQQSCQPCFSQNYPTTGNESIQWPNLPTPACYPMANQGYCPSPAPFNTSGLYTPEQYYAGQQTSEPTWPATFPSQGQMDRSHPQAEPATSSQEPQISQYPCVYVSQAGLITVLLKHDVSVEFTVDKTLRLVSHQRKLVIASNSRGGANCLYHPNAKVCHEGTTTEVELSGDRKVRMCTEDILIAKGDRCYRFDYKEVQEAMPEFRDISKDDSVSLLFGSSGYGPAWIDKCLELAHNAQYTHNDDGSFRIRINDISISQTNRGDVSVLCGPKFLKMAPISSYLRLQTHFIDMAVYKNAKIFVRRGTHSLDGNPASLRVDNGNLELRFEDGEDMSVCRLPRRVPLSGLSRRQRKKCHQGQKEKKSKYSWQSQ